MKTIGEIFGFIPFRWSSCFGCGVAFTDKDQRADILPVDHPMETALHCEHCANRRGVVGRIAGMMCNDEGFFFVVALDERELLIPVCFSLVDENAEVDGLRVLVAPAHESRFATFLGLV